MFSSSLTDTALAWRNSYKLSVSVDTELTVTADGPTIIFKGKNADTVSFGFTSLSGNLDGTVAAGAPIEYVSGLIPISHIRYHTK